MNLPYNEAMPKLSEAARGQRRARIMDAARACVDEHGLEAVSMEMIIARTGMSTGTVYRYFTGKDDVISAAVLDGTEGLASVLLPLLTQDAPPPPGEFMGQILHVILGYGDRGRVDLTRVALHGWSHSQSDPALQAAVRGVQLAVRERFAEVCRRWQAAGVVAPGCAPEAVAQLMLSVTLGFIAQRTLAGEADISAHVAAITALACPARVLEGIDHCGGGFDDLPEGTAGAVVVDAPDVVWALFRQHAEADEPAELLAYFPRIQRCVHLFETGYTGNGPQVMATVRNLAISLLHLTGVKEITRTLQAIARDRNRILDYLPL